MSSAITKNNNRGVNRVQRILITVVEEGEKTIRLDDCMVIEMASVERDDAKELVADYLDLAYDEHEEGETNDATD